MGEVAPPAHIRVLKNGVWYDTEKGRIVPGGHITTAIRTSERGKELNERRQEVAAAKARKAITEAAQQGGFDARGPTDAYGAIAGEFFRSAIANAMEKPRDATQAAKLALRLARMLLPEERRAGPVAAVQVVVSGEGLARLEDRIEGQVVEGEVA